MLLFAGICFVPFVKIVFVSFNTESLFTHEACVTWLGPRWIFTWLKVGLWLGVETIQALILPGETLCATLALCCAVVTWTLGPCCLACIRQSDTVQIVAMIESIMTSLTIIRNFYPLCSEPIIPGIIIIWREPHHFITAERSPGPIPAPPAAESLPKHLYVVPSTGIPKLTAVVTPTPILIVFNVHI